MAPRVLVVDNYDSFTFNLAALLTECGAAQPEVVRNDQVSPALARSFTHVLISPGPGLPREAGSTCELIRELAPSASILGVCLGHQAIAEVFGARLIRLSSPEHGVTRPVMTTSEPSRLFHGLPGRFDAGFYHSWEVDPASVPAHLAVTAVSPGGAVCALSHREHDVQGVQFHPESVMTPLGAEIIANWLSAQPRRSTANSGSPGRRSS